MPVQDFAEQRPRLNALVSRLIFERLFETVFGRPNDAVAAQASDPVPVADQGGCMA